MTIGKIIRRAREKRGLTQKQIAEQLGISVSYITKIETDELLPGDETLINIAQTVGLDSTALLERLQTERTNNQRQKQEARNKLRRQTALPVVGHAASHVTNPIAADTSADTPPWVEFERHCKELAQELEKNPEQLEWANNFLELLVQNVRR